MDPVTSSQFLILKDSFARKGVNVEAAYTPTGDLDYIYVVDRLLIVNRDDNIARLQAVMPGLYLADPDHEPEDQELVRLSIEDVSIDTGEPGSLTVPEVLDIVDERLGGNRGRAGGDEPLTTPVTIHCISKITPAGEPEVPSGYPTQPWPAPVPAGGLGVKIGISDTGLQPGFTGYAWMANVTGDLEPLGNILNNGLRRIPPYAGHGTFGAGVAASAAPQATVYVNNHFTESEGEAEDVIVRKLGELILSQSPDVVCLPAGTYNRNHWQSLAFNKLHQMYPDLVLIASAGNDSRSDPFYPAAYSWVVGVGALATDQQHRAWFSNYGSWVNVYALGEGLVNAYASGEYTYRESPRAPAKQTFTGMARWAGTSFSAPLVAGFIAEEMARSGTTAEDAKDAVITKAKAQRIHGVGPALLIP